MGLFRRSPHAGCRPSCQNPAVNNALAPARAELARLAKSFCEKSLSTATRTTYARVVSELIGSIDLEPLAVTPEDVRRFGAGTEP